MADHDPDDPNIYVRALLELLFWGSVAGLIVGMYYAVKS